MSQNRGQQNEKSNSSRRRKKQRKKPKMDPAKYWGDSSLLPSREDYTIDVADPTAVIRSLGKAPIPGKPSAPELYFDVLYERAAGLAKALAFAGGLDQADSRQPSTSESSPSGLAPPDGEGDDD